METIAGYIVEQVLFESPQSIVYRCRLKAGKKTVILKVLKNEFPTQSEIARYRREYEILKSLDCDGVVRAEKLETFDNRLIIVLEDFGGDSLRNVLGRQKLEMRSFLRIAIRLADILGEVHRQNIIHKDINPTNILWNPRTDTVKIIDFGISAHLSSERPEYHHASVLEGTLPYISPEQTGRMNRSVDYRTDYYSLGVTFYEMITGFLPFHTQDAMEMVHCHIARQPVPPDQAVADLYAGDRQVESRHELKGMMESIPPVLSEIVLKLMEKPAESRYQSIYGFKADLQNCLEQLDKNGRIRHFSIGTDDTSDRFQLSQKLYGREDELKFLLSVFEATSMGESHLMFVTGAPGVGKSALVNEVHKPIVRRRCYFGEGMFDQFKRNEPYSAIVHAFQGLAQQILNLPEETLKKWKKRFKNVLGPNGEMITRIIPEVEKIIGPQPPVKELNPSEAANRFLITFGNFVKVFARPEHPLVLFLDDLQWSDAASLKLLERLMTMKDLTHFLVIGAYRDNEVTHGHPLHLAIEEIEKYQDVHRVRLEPLSLENINHLVSDTFHCDPVRSRPMAELIYSKTGGNPFFSNELLKNLYHEKLIYFSPESGIWEWDLERTQKIEVSDNVVEFIIQRLSELPGETRQSLQLAACIGSYFDFKTLSLIDELLPHQTAGALWNAVEQGIIIPLNSEYRLLHSWKGEEHEAFPDFDVSYQFQHDRIRQAAYSLIQEDKKQEVHLEIGRLMLKHTGAEMREEKVIDIVRHLNMGIPLITDPEEKDELVRLNLAAGKKAKDSSAYFPAFRFLETAKGLLPEDSWETDYLLTVEVMQRYAESAYLCGEFEIGEQYAGLLVKKVKTRRERAGIREMQSAHYTYLGKLEDAIRAGIQGLRQLGIKLKKVPSMLAVVKELAKAKWTLRGKTTQELLESPLLTNPQVKLSMRLLIDFIPPAYLSGQKNLFAVAVLKKASFSARFGNCPESAPAYIGYAILLAGLGDIKGAYNYGTLAVKLNQRFDDLEWRSLVYVLYALFCHSWNQPWRTLPDWFKKTIEAGLQAGDLMYTAYACVYVNLWNPTIDLENAIKQQDKYVSLAEETKNKDAIDSARLVRQRWLNFRGHTNDRFSFNDGTFIETRVLQRMKDDKFLSGVAIYYIYKLHVHYMYGDYPTALEYLEEADNVIEALLGSPFMEEYCIFGFLTLAACYPGLSGSEKRAARKRMKKEYRRMKKWSDNYPDNFSHHRYLMEAELARMAGNDLEALKGYNRAMKAAGENDFLRYRALTSEITGRFYIEQGQDRLAGIYLKDAHYYYAAWGADAKVKQLEEEYPTMVWTTAGKALAEVITSGSHPSDTGSSTREGLDLSTILKVSQAISKEINLSELLKKIMRIVIENAGAQRGFLILRKDDCWCISAEGNAQGNTGTVDGNESMEDSGRLARSVIHYVIRTRENVVLDDATNDDRFASDSYIIKNRPKSILCSPMISQGKIGGIWYLENNLAVRAFTPERLTILDMLSYQIAISLDNAYMYRTLEELNKTLEQKVIERTMQLNEKNKQVMDSINYAQVIQSSTLPKEEKVRRYVPEHFIIWQPRDVVGGDFWWFEPFGEDYLVALGDCTGHGVPGAMMTMTASSVLGRIVAAGVKDDPAAILRELNILMRAGLNQDLQTTLSDDGIDIGICYVKPRERKLVYAGARIPLYFYNGSKIIETIKGARMSLGYKRSREDYRYPNHHIDIPENAVFYLTTDGFIHQNGGEKDLSFGRKRFQDILMKIGGLPLDKQKEVLKTELRKYQGQESQRDDIAVLGLKI